VARSDRHYCRQKKYYILWACICSLRNKACKTHAPYYIVICCLSGL